jgi:DNA-binding LacI/PurR family transcriptional regulator
VLLESLDDEYEAGVLQGAHERATREGAVIVAFAGGVVNAEWSKAQNVVFDLVSPDNVDGLVVLSSAIGNEVGSEGLAAWLQRFHPLPMTAIGAPVPGIVHTGIDNESGLRAAVRHLIVEHQCRRFAFIRGPRASAEAEERYDAFVAELGDSQLSVDSRFVVDGDYRLESGAEAVKTLLEKRRINPASLDAIVAANDYMALGAQDELLRRGLAVPDGIRVVGFDDIRAASQVRPPLTTVRQPLRELGAAGVEVVLATLRKKEVTAQRLPAEVVIRQSCGCTPEIAPLNLSRRFEAQSSEQSLEIALLRARQPLLVEVLRASRGTLAGGGSGWEAHLIEALYAEARGEHGAFLRGLEQLVRRLLRAGNDLVALQDVITALRDNVLHCVRGDSAARDRIEDAFHGARLCAAAHVTRQAVELATKSAAHLRQLSRGAEFSLLAQDESLSKLAADHMPALGIDACFLMAFTEPGRATPESELVAGFARSEVFSGRARFPTQALLPPYTIDLATRSVVIEPVVFAREILGFAVFEYGTSDGSVYEDARDTFGTTIKAGLLARELARLRRAHGE